jgi:hypothetical protein
VLFIVILAFASWYMTKLHPEAKDREGVKPRSLVALGDVKGYQ